MIMKLLEKFPWRVVRREVLDDHDDMAYRFSCVLDHTTGRMSKTNYTKEAMYSEIDDAFSRREDAARKEGYCQAWRDQQDGFAHEYFTEAQRAMNVDQIYLQYGEHGVRREPFKEFFGKT